MNDFLVTLREPITGIRDSTIFNSYCNPQPIVTQLGQVSAPVWLGYIQLERWDINTSHVSSLIRDFVIRQISNIRFCNTLLAQEGTMRLRGIGRGQERFALRIGILRNIVLQATRSN